jgi:hypothetical protein
MQLFFIWDFLLTGHGHANFFYIFFCLGIFFPFNDSVAVYVFQIDPDFILLGSFVS